MALTPSQRRKYIEELEKYKHDELVQKTIQKSHEKSQFQNLRRFMNLKNDEEEKEKELFRKCTSTRRIEADERLAQELVKVKSQDLKELKERQLLRQNCPELRELESKLRAAYVAKELKTQMAEKEANKLIEKLQEKQAFKTLQSVWTQEEELRIKKTEEDLYKKAQYRQDLTEQIMTKRKIEYYLYEEFLKDKKMIDDIIEELKEEERKRVEQKMLNQMKTREEIQKFKAIQAEYERKEKERIAEENRKLEEYMRKLEETKRARQAEKERQEALKALTSTKLLEQVFVEEMKRKERDEIMQCLAEEEQKAAEEARHRRDIEKMVRAKIDMKAGLAMQWREKEAKLRREMEEDAKFQQEMLAKAIEDQRLELLSEQKKRLKMIQVRKDVEEMMQERRRRRAEEMQLLKKMREDEERAEEERRRIIEEERMKLLKEHAKNLIGYIPRSVLKPEDLQYLGENFLKPME